MAILKTSLPDNDEFSKYKDFHNENIRTIQIKLKIFKILYSMLLDISTFKSKKFKTNKNTTPFDYNFDKFFKK